MRLSISLNETISALRNSPLVLSLTDWVVLGVLAETPRHGFAVARELSAEAELGQIWTVRRPLVYRSLDHLEDVGLIEARTIERGDQGPHRRVLAPTRAARRRLEQWLDEPIGHPRDARAALLVKFALRARRGLPLASLARAQSVVFEDALSALGRQLQEADGVQRVIAQYRYEANLAIHRFLDAVISMENRPGRDRRTITA